MSTSRQNHRGRSPSRGGGNDPLRSTMGSAGITTRRSAKSPAFREKLRQMALPLAPLVQMTSGEVHGAFPKTLLNFWLLTEPELDDLAHFYHQRTPGPWTLQYPCPVTWDGKLTLEEKRRKMGKFIGLRGCETPIVVVAPCTESQAGAATETTTSSPQTPKSPHPWLRTKEQIMEKARQARLAEYDDDEQMRKKLRWYQ